MKTILKQVCTLTGVSEQEVRGSNRRHDLVCCRALFSYLCEERKIRPKEYCLVINKDRTTVIRYSNKIYYSPIFKKMLKQYKNDYCDRPRHK